MLGFLYMLLMFLTIEMLNTHFVDVYIYCLLHCLKLAGVLVIYILLQIIRTIIPKVDWL